MPRYTVVSGDAFEDEMAALFSNPPPGSTRQDVREASDWIDQYLRQDADAKGSQVQGSPSLRFLERYPLRIYFAVSADDRMVRLVAVEASTGSP